MTSPDPEAEDESIQVDLDLLLTHIQKTVLILAQALNTMSYYKTILKEKADILGEKDFLLGKDFWNQILKDTEAKAKMHNAVQRKKKGAKVQPQASTTPQHAELPTNLFIKKRETVSIPRNRSVW